MGEEDSTTIWSETRRNDCRRGQQGDLDLFRMAGLSIAFNSSCKDLDQMANICVQSRNLADIIPKLPL